MTVQRKQKEKLDKVKGKMKEAVGKLKEKW